MFESTDQSEGALSEMLDAALRQGLRDIPVPHVSPEFDNRIMQAIHRPHPWWLIDWRREGFSLIIPISTAVFACIATLGMTLWTGAAGPVRFTPNRVVQNVIQAALQAADSGQVSPTTLLLRSPRASAGASQAPSVPAALAAPPAESPLSAIDKHHIVP